MVDTAEIRHLEKSTLRNNSNSNKQISIAPYASYRGALIRRGWSDLDKISQTMVQNDTPTAVIWSKSKPEVEFQYGGRLGEFNGMSSQSHVSRCRV